jgi:hypothetical protein
MAGRSHAALFPKRRHTISSAVGQRSGAARAWPFAMSCGTIDRTVSIGIAKPTPADVPVAVKIAVLTPMTAPRESSSGPPELPGLIAASVWMPPAMTPPAGHDVLCGQRASGWRSGAERLRCEQGRRGEVHVTLQFAHAAQGRRCRASKTSDAPVRALVQPGIVQQDVSLSC